MSWCRWSALAAFLTSVSLLTGCMGGPSGSAKSTESDRPPKTITSISLTPATISLNVNGTQQLKAIANYSDRTTADLTSTAAWATSNSAVATVSTGGLVTAIAPGQANVTVSSGEQTASASITVNAPQRALTSITISPQNGTITAGNTLQLKATGNYSDNTSTDITSSVSWSSSNSAIATVNGSGLVTGVAQGTATIAAGDGAVSASAAVTVSPASAPSGNVNVTTYHFDNKRTGLNNNETILTPAKVKSGQFGKLFSLTVDGYVYAQPLYMSGVTINGAQHNVVFVSTEKNVVYAFDADNYNNNVPLWKTSLMNAGESPASRGNPSPYQGSTSTPVIDSNTGTLYVVTTQNNGGANNFRLHAINISNGSVIKTATVTATVSPAQNSDAVKGVLTLPSGILQRAALLLDNGTIYIGFSASGSGWLLAYDAATLSQKGVFAVGPNNDGNGTYKGDGGIWMGGGGPVADGMGNVYVSTGNGPYNNSTQAYGDSILRFDSSLNLKDWFTPQDYMAMQCEDQDLSGGGMLMLPNGNLVAGGKSAKLFQVDALNLGQGPHSGDSDAITTLFPGDNVGMKPYSFTCTAEDTTNPPNGQPYPTGTWTGTKTPYQLFGTPAYYNNSIYVGMTPGPVVQVAIDSAGKLMLTSNATKEQVATGSYGTTPVISANNNSDAILWFIDHGIPLQSGTPTHAVLRAYDPDNLGQELYDSGMSSADTAGYGVKFTAPIVANGKVYFATANDPNLATDSQGEIDVYGLK